MEAWNWLSTEPNGVLVALSALQAPDEAKAKVSPTASALPPVIAGVVLVMELALVGGATFLLLLSSSVAGKLVRSILHVLLAGCIQEDAVVNIIEAAVFCWGLLALIMGRFFRRPKQELGRRLWTFRRHNATSCMLSVLLHCVAVVAVLQYGDQHLVSWEHIHSALFRQDGSVDAANALQRLLLTPLKEELFFRGTIMLVTFNRMHSVRLSVILSTSLFAAIHLTNIKRIGSTYSASYVALQVVWAGLVGGFLALKFANTGSLMECLVLHSINNAFSLAVPKQAMITLSQSSIASVVATGVAIYGIAIARQLQNLQHSAKHKHS